MTDSKKRPSHNVYKDQPDRQPGQDREHMGVMFAHGIGEGFNILIKEDRYVAFPVKPEAEEKKEPDPGSGTRRRRAPDQGHPS